MAEDLARPKGHGGDQAEAGAGNTFVGMDTPRIRHITGICIHQLTIHDPRSQAPAPGLGYSISEHPESPSTSPTLPRRPSHRRQPSSSTHISPSSTLPSRTGTITGRRTRAPTLAGEALEHAREVVQVVKEEQAEAKERKLAKTFVILKLPERTMKEDAAVPGPSRKGKERVQAELNGNGQSNGNGVGRTGIKVQPQRTNGQSRPNLSASSSKSSIHSPPSSGRSTPTAGSKSKGPTSSATTRLVSRSRTDSTSSSEAPRRFGKGPADSKVNATGHKNDVKVNDTPYPPALSVPFYISPIHKPSTSPRYLSLEEGDFAPWLSVEEAAGNQALLEVWYEDDIDGQWRKAEACSRRINLNQLRRVNDTTKLPENSILLTISLDPKSTFYIPASDEVSSTATQARVGNGVLERSKRETRMQKGAGLGALHQLVNMQAVIADTQRGIAEVQLKIDQLLRKDVDGRALRREVSERESRVRWFQDRVDEVEKDTEEAHAGNVLRRKTLDERRARLQKAEKQDEHLRTKLSELEVDLETTETDRSSLIPAIHHTRSQHVQALDSLFPISPLHGPSLLYNILDIPLPIPVGPKDPAPPLVMTLPDGKGKVDEKTTAAALGYVAMVVQVLGNLSGTRKEGGLSYPITCAGSRSLVKDTVSVMQGPRSFPLYAKGVERYRYEYAVFLLNKNIEMLMQEASIRMVDLRHTLPNLKSLLLTLSSPIPPPQRRIPQNPRSGFTSRMTSRQTSQAYSIPQFSSSGTSTTLADEYDIHGSPIKRAVKGRRSRLSRASVLGDEGESDAETELGTADGTETADLDVETDRSLSMVASP